jgi:membrane protein
MRLMDGGSLTIAKVVIDLLPLRCGERAGVAANVRHLRVLAVSSHGLGLGSCGMQLALVKKAARNTTDDVMKNHTLAFAAALSYYFVLSLFPLLIVLAAVLAYVPLPHLFDAVLGVMGRVIPPDSMHLVRTIIASIVTPKRGSLLTLGIVLTVWSASGGFAAMIEALNVAYDVPETRPYWKTRPLAVGLTFLIGLLMVMALGVMVVGPRFGGWLAGKIGLGPVFVAVWPYLRWSIAIAFTILAVELLYYLAPNVRQRFKCTLPGAAIAVGGWLALSFALGIYFQNFANFNKTYGTLGAAIALFVWFYWTGLVMLVGAEFNSELLQVAGEGKLPLKQPPPPAVRPKQATEADLAA